MTARGAGEEHAGMKLIIPSNELNDKTSGGGLRIMENTKQGYKVATPGDGVNLASRMRHQRGNVQKNSIQTLKAQMEIGVVVNEQKDHK